MDPESEITMEAGMDGCKKVGWICPKCGGVGPHREGAGRVEAIPEMFDAMRKCSCEGEKPDDR